MELVITLITLKVGNIIILSTNIAIGFNLRKLVPPKCINSTFLCTYSIRLIMARHLTFYENVTFKERPENPRCTELYKARTDNDKKVHIRLRCYIPCSTIRVTIAVTDRVVVL